MKFQIFNITSKKKFCRVATDWALVLSMSLIILILELFIQPYQRGFFCDDENVRYPVKPNTYPAWSLGVITAIPVVIICVTEYLIDRCSLKSFCLQIYKQIGVFMFGFLVHFLLVDYIKYCGGRLRPHFYELCQPVFPDGSDCSNPMNHGIYITNFTCSNPSISVRSLKEFRLSFPSGHSSVTFYAMTYLALYIHGRWDMCKILKFFCEFMCILLAVSVAVSRVSDYWHFWSDVCVGSLIGFISAILVVTFILELFKRRKHNIGSEIQLVSGVV